MLIAVSICGSQHSDYHLPNSIYILASRTILKYEDRMDEGGRGLFVDCNRRGWCFVVCYISVDEAPRRGRYYSHKLNEDDCFRSEFS